MTTYSQSDFEQIADAIKVDLEKIMEYRLGFESAARWYRLDKNRPRRTPPNAIKKKLHSVAKAAKRLLNHLGVDDVSAAPDGPGDEDILVYLAGDLATGEDAVVNATARIGRLVEILQAVEAAKELGDRAKAGAKQAAEIGPMITPPRNSSITPINGWIDGMLGLYKQITGKEPRTSVSGPENQKPGVAQGPTIRFIQAAGRPLGIELSADAVRKRIETSRKAARRRN